MPRDGNKTRLKIIDNALALVLENGFVGTSLDAILEKTKITKGAFFYHFKSKSELAQEMIRYYAKNEAADLELALKQSQTKEDPADQLLEFVQWHLDFFHKLDKPFPGCLYASYLYEFNQFDDKTKDVIESSFLSLRKTLSDLIQKTADTYQVNNLDTESLADQFIVILQGSFIVSKSLNDPRIITSQLNHYQDYLRLIFGVQ